MKNKIALAVLIASGVVSAIRTAYNMGYADGTSAFLAELIYGPGTGKYDGKYVPKNRRETWRERWH